MTRCLREVYFIIIIIVINIYFCSWIQILYNVLYAIYYGFRVVLFSVCSTTYMCVFLLLLFPILDFAAIGNAPGGGRICDLTSSLKASVWTRKDDRFSPSACRRLADCWLLSFSLEALEAASLAELGLIRVLLLPLLELSKVRGSCLIWF